VRILFSYSHIRIFTFNSDHDTVHQEIQRYVEQYLARHPDWSVIVRSNLNPVVIPDVVEKYEVVGRVMEELVDTATPQSWEGAPAYIIEIVSPFSVLVFLN